MAIDKRIIKTQKAIKEAFMLLTMDKEIEKITVSDIAEKAFINRSTFYLHYNDARDVMQDIEREWATTSTPALKISILISRMKALTIYY